MSPPQRGREPPVDEHVCRGADGWRLHVVDVRPAGEARACALVGHAMMVDRRTVWRPGRPSLVGALRDAGCRVLAPELRGRGESGPSPRQGANWTYDSLVEDTRAYLELARDVAGDLPLFLVGHSLFGHTSLAFLGRYPADEVSRRVAGVVALAVAVWGPTDEPSWRRRLARRTAVEVVGGLTRVLGYVPAGRLRFGTADEAAGYWRDFVRYNRRGEWRARDGFDYHAGLARVACPILWVVSEGDRLSPPSLSERFAEPLPRRRILRVGAHAPRADVVVEPPPHHMALVTDSASRPAWEAAARWILERAAERPGGPTETRDASVPEGAGGD